MRSIILEHPVYRFSSVAVRSVYKSNSRSVATYDNKCGSNLGPVKSDTVLPTARHCCDFSSNEAVLPAGTMTGDGPRKLVTRFGVE